LYYPYTGYINSRSLNGNNDIINTKFFYYTVTNNKYCTCTIHTSVDKTATYHYTSSTRSLNSKSWVCGARKCNKNPASFERRKQILVYIAVICNFKRNRPTHTAHVKNINKEMHFGTMPSVKISIYSACVSQL